MAKIALRCGKKDEMRRAFEKNLDENSIADILEFINCGRTQTPIGESAATAVEYAKYLVSK